MRVAQTQETSARRVGLHENLGFTFSSANGFCVTKSSGNRCLDHGAVSILCDANCTHIDTATSFQIGDIDDMKEFIQLALHALKEVDDSNAKAGWPRKLQEGFEDKIWQKR